MKLHRAIVIEFLQNLEAGDADSLSKAARIQGRSPYVATSSALRLPVPVVVYDKFMYEGSCCGGTSTQSNTCRLYPSSGGGCLAYLGTTLCAVPAMTRPLDCRYASVFSLLLSLVIGEWVGQFQLSSPCK